MSVDQLVEGAVRRDRIVVLAALSVVVGLSWTYIVAGAGMTMSMTPTVWDAGYAVLMFFMWWIMMIAMMLPSAAPMILMFAAMNRKQRDGQNAHVPTALFAAAYLIVWAGFSLAAVAVQWGLESTALLSPMLSSASAVLGGCLLLAAGLYQLTPLKQACLSHCRAPLQFMLGRWRGGARGALRMGTTHGAYCVGCCWFLMGLLFFGGVMNIFWIAGLAVFVLLEKTLPGAHGLARLVGVALLGWGAFVLTGAI